jgi:hypothetical protein
VRLRASAVLWMVHIHVRSADDRMDSPLLQIGSLYSHPSMAHHALVPVHAHDGMQHSSMLGHPSDMMHAASMSVHLTQLDECVCGTACWATMLTRTRTCGQ